MARFIHLPTCVIGAGPHAWAGRHLFRFAPLAVWSLTGKQDGHLSWSATGLPTGIRIRSDPDCTRRSLLNSGHLSKGLFPFDWSQKFSSNSERTGAPRISYLIFILTSKEEENRRMRLYSDQQTYKDPYQPIDAYDAYYYGPHRPTRVIAGPLHGQRPCNCGCWHCSRRDHM